jgi:hypothetical protein
MEKKVIICGIIFATQNNGSDKQGKAFHSLPGNTYVD